MNSPLPNHEPLFDVDTMKRHLSNIQTNNQALNGRISLATSVFNGMLSNKDMLGFYRDDARASVLNALNEQNKIQAVQNGQIQPAQMTPEQAELIKNTTFASMIRASYFLADQIIAADKYLEPGSMLLVPLQERRHADQDQESQPTG